MKSTLLRGIMALLIISLVSTVIIVDYKYGQSLIANDSKAEIIKGQEENTAEKLARQEKEAELKRELATYTLERESYSHNRFVNKVDGYSISVPKDMKADMNISHIRAVLENQNLKIEIYRQEVQTATDSGIDSYINYSNKFIENDIDHKKENEDYFIINGRNVYMLQWSREPLKHVENDKNFYASIDVSTGENEVITFLFKSNASFQEGEYLDMVKSLEVEEKTKEPYYKKIKQVKNSSWDEATAEVYEKYFGLNSSLTWGIFEGKALVDSTELKEIEAKLDFLFPIVLYYTGFIEGVKEHPRVVSVLANASKEKRLVELTLQTVEQEAWKGNMIYDVLDGKYDEFLKNYVEAVVNSQKPVLFRIGNEMNGDWCVYSAHHTSKDTEIYKAFYKYIYKLFEEAGADNIIWVWNPNGKSFPDFKWNDELCYYPGDEFVDVIGMTSYNTGTYYPGETWTEFDEMYDPIYEKYIDLYEKPLMITEFASSSVGGDKVAWVQKMFNHITNYERIKVAIWWDGCDWDIEGNVARPYFIDETDELVKIFKENLAKYK